MQIGLICTSTVVAQVLPQLPLLNLLLLPVLAARLVYHRDGLIRDAMLIMPMGVYLIHKNQTPRHLLLNPALQLVWPPGTQLQVWSSVLSVSVVMLLLMVAFSRTPIQIATPPALATAKKNAVAVIECPSTPEVRFKLHNLLVLKKAAYQVLGLMVGAKRKSSPRK